jgi:hypothetical protein
LGLSQFPILAKRRYTLPALLMLGYQNPPLRQGLLSTLIHAPSLPQSALADKMWFRYRSPFFAYCGAFPICISLVSSARAGCASGMRGGSAFAPG